MKMTEDIALSIIASTPRGKERAELLHDDAFRKMVLNSGANITIYSGKIKDGNTCMEMLSDVHIGLIRRKNKKGKPDGIGALGGMAERTSEVDFFKMPETERLTLIGKKDDVIIVNGKTVLTKDMDIIRKNNVLREMREELADLNINEINIDTDRMKLVSMPKVKDDNYIINIWDGRGKCFAVTPYSHLYEDREGLLDTLSSSATEKIGGEAASFDKISLFDALSAYGNPANGGSALEDGRNANLDYRYPHEYLVTWCLAAELLQHNPEKMKQLACEVQQHANHPISFETLAKATGQNMEDIADIMQISPDTLTEMENLCAKQFATQKKLISARKTR